MAAMTTEQRREAGRKAWAAIQARRAAIAAGEPVPEPKRKKEKAAAAEVETEAARRKRQRRAYEERCERVGFPEKGGGHDPDVWRAEGYDAMADHIEQTWGVPWSPPGFKDWLRDQRNGVARTERKRGRKGAAGGRKVWKFE